MTTNTKGEDMLSVQKRNIQVSLHETVCAPFIVLLFCVVGSVESLPSRGTAMLRLLLSWLLLATSLTRRALRTSLIKLKTLLAPCSRKTGGWSGFFVHPLFILWLWPIAAYCVALYDRFTPCSQSALIQVSFCDTVGKFQAQCPWEADSLQLIISHYEKHIPWDISNHFHGIKPFSKLWLWDWERQGLIFCSR